MTYDAEWNMLNVNYEVSNNNWHKQMINLNHNGVLTFMVAERRVQREKEETT